MSASGDRSPLVSVVMGTYNRAELVTETLGSVLAQTYPNFEVIVVDDGSTDNTREVIERGYGDRVRYVYQENQGAGSSRQTGIDLAEGELIAFQDDDELWLPEKLAKQVAALQAHPDFGFCYCNCLRADETGRSLGEPCRHSSRGVTGDCFVAYLWHGVIHHASAMVRKVCLDEIGGMNTSMRVAEDFDLYLRLTARFNGVYLREPLVLVREHPGQKSVAHWRALQTHRAVCRSLRGLMMDLPANCEAKRSSIQRRLAELELLGVNTDQSWDGFVEELAAANRYLSQFEAFSIVPHLTARRMIDWIAVNDARSPEQTMEAISNVAEAWEAKFAARGGGGSMRARVVASLGLQLFREGRGASWMLRALVLCPGAASAQVVWALPGALRGLVHRKSEG